MRIPQPVENELTSVLLHLSLLKAFFTPKGLSTSQRPVWFRSRFVALSCSRALLIPLPPFGLRSDPRARCAALLSSGMQQDTYRCLAGCPATPGGTPQWADGLRPRRRTAKQLQG